VTAITPFDQQWTNFFFKEIQLPVGEMTIVLYRFGSNIICTDVETGKTAKQKREGQSSFYSSKTPHQKKGCSASECADSPWIDGDSMDSPWGGTIEV
jgi:hypothetical protein